MKLLNEYVLQIAARIWPDQLGSPLNLEQQQILHAVTLYVEEVLNSIIKPFPPQTRSLLIEEAVSGSRGDDQKRIAEEGLLWLETLLKKNADYGSSVFKSPVLLPRLQPASAILVRMSDKIQRLTTLLNDAQSGPVGGSGLPVTSPQVLEESFADTLRDLGAYALLYLCAPKE